VDGDGHAVRISVEAADRHHWKWRQYVRLFRRRPVSGRVEDLPSCLQRPSAPFSASCRRGRWPSTPTSGELQCPQLTLSGVLLHTSGFRFSGRRLPDGDDKRRILSAVDQARACIPLRAVLRFLGVSSSRFHAWRRRRHACALDDASSCPRTSPHRLTRAEVQAIGDMVASPQYRHVPTGTLAILAQRLGTVSASPSTWYGLVQKYGWRRPRLQVHQTNPKIGLRTTAPDEMWHIDTRVVRLLDGTRAYLHAVIDNFSRRILAWRVDHTSAAVNSLTVLLEAIAGATRSPTAPVVLADAGVEIVNAQVDALIASGVVGRLLALAKLKFSNSMLEAWWRSLKDQWLFLPLTRQHRHHPPAGGVLRP
jgi:putative transposase